LGKKYVLIYENGTTVLRKEKDGGDETKIYCKHFVSVKVNPRYNHNTLFKKKKQNNKDLLAWMVIYY
jgi:hypothetical protein